MEKHSNYTAIKPDEHGLVHYTQENNETWAYLYERQIKIIQNRACDEYVHGLDVLSMNAQRIPQCAEISKRLRECTGWEVAPVAALISFEEFFKLLSLKQFPAATFIRRKDEIDYLKEPDIFHELFGHCPLLTDKNFAAFTCEVGKLGVSLSKEERVLLARLYWFTVEFGLINTAKGLRIYGGGILSSKEETIYALESTIPHRKNFDLLTVLRTHYRYDELQRNYFVIESFEQVYNLMQKDLTDTFKEAKELGLLGSHLKVNEESMRSC